MSARGVVESESGRGPGLEFAIGALTENWGMKILALLLALVVFIVTRDEVTRSFTIPLRVVEDPDRVLLTSPPETVELRLRGPWVNVNQIAAAELGSAMLDLREARPGPMEIDPASVVMPRGVVLDRLDYDPVDLRFEALVERRIPVEPSLEGTVDDDYLLGASRVEPDSLVVRGRASVLDEIDALATEAVDLSGISEPFTLELGLAEIPPGVQLLGVEEGGAPQVRVFVELIPVIGEVDLVIATGDVLREALGDEAGEVPESERVTVRGPRAVLGQLEALPAPLVPHVEIEGEGAGVDEAVTLRFEWAGELDAKLTKQLTITPPLIRLRLGQAREPAGAADE